MSGTTHDSGLHGLLTVDFSAQLRKTILHSHTFPEQYLVECIRWCLGVGAASIRVESTPKELLIRWDGGPAPAGDLTALEHLFGPDHPWEVRETALEHFHGQKGLGLLSAWACSPKSVVLHVLHQEGIQSLEYRLDFFNSRHQPLPSPGPGGLDQSQAVSQSLRLVRKGDVAAEATAVRDYCRFAAASILFNGQETTVGSLPPEGLAGFRLKDEAGDPLGLVWIPRKGDLCRLVLLRRGIRWKMVATTTHRKGIIYEGAVEAEGIAQGLMQTLDHAATKLYGRLADGLEKMNTPDRQRVEHLLLSYSRVTGDTRLLENARLFPLADGTGFLSLGELRVAAAEARVGSVRDFVSARHASAFPMVLVRLADAQATFLREMGIEVPALGRKALLAHAAPSKRLQHLLRRAWGQWFEGRVVPPERQSSDQRSLMVALEGGLVSGSFVPAGVAHGIRVTAELRTGRARASVQLGQGCAIVRLHTGNPRLKSALARHAAGAPVRLLLPWLLEGEGGWTQLFSEPVVDAISDSGTTSPDAPTRPM